MPNLLMNEFDENKFKNETMPFTDFINAKSEGSGNKTKGALYRGTLHFGIELHRMIEET